jgi:hypothetical protein|tara:strand:+ start:261 stop:833 length:573 start_codon:yes stop_codon:yes gene_type:complete
MNISTINDALFIGNIAESPTPYRGNKPVLHRHKLKVQYNKNLASRLESKHLSIVYFICVDDIIYKIGQTSGKNGIKGCLNFYCSAGQDDPGHNRFAINALIREHINDGRKVSVYMKFLEPIWTQAMGINKAHQGLVPASAKWLEEIHLEDYREIVGANPPWNYQESNTPVPARINEQFAHYRQMRAAART